ncbi:MAG: hypothetical protein Q9195_002362 [Heterodermia aff. obscurata]
MHFPPGDDGDEVLVSIDADDEILPRLDNDPSKSSGHSTFTSWTEPALRSDRLCWSLIGLAHNLAYEIGIFGSFADVTPIDAERSQRLERILYIYISQTSGRLGLSSTFHRIAGEDDFTSLRLFLFDWVYINSLALQAVLEQWTSSASQSHSQSLSNVYKTNEIYIKEVVSASRNLLRQVVDGLLPNDYLKHVPVRTFFRILSGAMFLLKSFALGAKENEVMASLVLLDRTIKALRTSVVDDVHLCLRIADLLEGLTTSVRSKFVRLAGQSSTREGNSPLPIPPGPHRPASRMNPSTQEDIDPDPDLNPYNNTNNKTNISFLPPPTNDIDYTISPANPLSPLLINHQLYPPTNNNDGGVDDWLTLDLNPLLDDSNPGGMDNAWLGNFGPEINGNLDVLGRLVSEGFGGAEMGF